MATLTGGIKDFYIDDDIMLMISEFPKLEKVDEQIFLKKLFMKLDPIVAVGFLLLMLDYNKTQVSYIIGKSPQWMYTNLVPSIKKAYKSVEE